VSRRAEDAEVGYGKPPRNTRFKKGQSRNPRGRPRKETPAATPDPMLPLDEVIKQEAARLVTVRDGDERASISTIDGVIRALAHTAMKGGVFAQRTLIELLREIEQRDLERKKQSFERWQNYVAETRSYIRDARARGQPEPEPVPHPDDIEFEDGNLEVRFTGPLDEEEAARARRNQRFSRLCVEMSLYHQEDNCRGEGPLANASVGFWLLSHVGLEATLPERMRITPLYLREAERRRATNRVWVAWLKHECEQLNLPFIKATKPWPVWKLSESVVVLPPRFYQE